MRVPCRMALAAMMLLSVTACGRLGYDAIVADDGGALIDGGTVIDAGTEPGPDASTSTAQNIYRSVGVGNVSPLASGAAITGVSITGVQATFTIALPPEVGVGDALEYDTTGDGNMDSIAFVQERISDSELTIVDAAGDPPTNGGASLLFRLYRAYTSLADAEEGIENSAIDPVVRDFDAWSGGNNLVTANLSWHIACYGDIVDATPVSVAGWTTGPEHFLRIFTPRLASEVGTSQRHTGRWRDSAYTLAVTEATAINVSIGFLRIEGLQIEVAATSNGSERNGIYTANVPVGPGLLRFSSNIIRGSFAGPIGNSAGMSLRAPAPVVTHAWNNIVYGYREANATGVLAGIHFRNGRIYAYNNTIYGCNEGLHSFNAEVQVARNNLLARNIVPVVGVFDFDYNIFDRATSATNLSFVDGFAPTAFVDADSPGGESILEVSSTEGFVVGHKVIVATGTLAEELLIIEVIEPDAFLSMTTNLAQDHTALQAHPVSTIIFANETAENFHISSVISVARDQGLNLAGDAELSFTNDIDGEARTGSWDIGADELVAQ